MNTFITHALLTAVVCQRFNAQYLGRMVCVNLTLAPGDVLYLPKGLVHVAQADSAPSMHISIGLRESKNTWMNFLKAFGETAFVELPERKAFESALAAFEATPVSTPWMRLFPM